MSPGRGHVNTGTSLLLIKPRLVLTQAAHADLHDGSSFMQSSSGRRRDSTDCPCIRRGGPRGRRGRGRSGRDTFQARAVTPPTVMACSPPEEGNQLVLRDEVGGDTADALDHRLGASVCGSISCVV